MEPMMKKPSLFRRVVMNLVDGWRRVMDESKYITILVCRHNVLVLFIMWSVSWIL